MPTKKITFKGMLSKMGNNRLVIIPKAFVEDLKLDDLRNRRLRITVIFDELN